MIQKTVVPWFRSRFPVSMRKRDRRRSSTGRDLDAEEANRPECQDQDEHGEDERLAPLAAKDRPTEHVDETDDEATDTGADDVADAAEHRRGERDDAEMEPEVPLQIAVVDAVDHRGRGSERRTDEEGG